MYKQVLLKLLIESLIDTVRGKQKQEVLGEAQEVIDNPNGWFATHFRVHDAPTKTDPAS